MPSEIKLFNQDCMEAMKEMPDKSFDLAIVDPPYGIGQNWSKSRKDRFYKGAKLHAYKNDHIPRRIYFKELMRVSKNQIIWGGNYYTRFLRPTNAWIIWAKNRDADITYMSEAEIAWSSFNKVMRFKQFTWDGFRKCEPCDKQHPHQKPVSLYKWLLRTYAVCGATILDTHLGSGSSAIACYDLGFHLTAFEIDKNYFTGAVKRLNNHKRQLTFI